MSHHLVNSYNLLSTERLSNNYQIKKIKEYSRISKNYLLFFQKNIPSET